MGRNKVLRPGINALSRSAGAAVRRRYLHAKKGANNKSKKVEKKAIVKLDREPRWYAADDVKKPLKSRKSHHKPTRLRKSITPGTVVIVLAGRFRGKRVIVLKQLQPSGLLLVTGPYKINGVPLRRINQAYVISTSTQVDVKGVDVKNVNDDFFQKQQAEKKKDGDFFAEKEKKNVLAPARKEAQKAVDAPLLATILKTPLLKQYLGAKFSLTKGQKPHELKF